MSEQKITKKITKDMSLAEITQKYPETMDVMFKHGLFCFGCPHASRETLEQGVAGHPGVELEVLLNELNAAVEKSGAAEKREAVEDSGKGRSEDSS